MRILCSALVLYDGTLAVVAARTAVIHVVERHLELYMRLALVYLWRTDLSASTVMEVGPLVWALKKDKQFKVLLTKSDKLSMLINLVLSHFKLRRSNLKSSRINCCCISTASVVFFTFFVFCQKSSL